jgi:hypothetical protein
MPSETSLLEQWRDFFRKRGDKKGGGLQHLLDLVHQYDKDGSGELSAYEFVLLCRELNKIYLAEAEAKVKAIEKTMVANETNRISVEEQDPMESLRLFTDAEVASFFRAVDVDNSGQVSDTELFYAIRGKPNMERQACIDYMFELIDTDCDGYLDFSEAVAFYGTSNIKIGSGSNKNSVKLNKEQGEKSHSSSSKNGVRKQTHNKTARAFIDHFDRRLHVNHALAKAELGKCVTLASEQNIGDKQNEDSSVVVDGRISRREFCLYWENRSFYVTDDIDFKKEFLNNFGVNMMSTEAKEWLENRLKSQIGAGAGSDSVEAPGSGTNNTYPSLCPSPPKQSMPSCNPSPRSNVVNPSYDINNNNVRTIETSSANRVPTNDSVVIQLANMHELLEEQKRQWKADVDIKDHIIKKQHDRILELEKILKDIQMNKDMMI